MTRKWDIPSNIDAQPCVRNVMMFLADIVGDRIVAGQHTQTMAQEELHQIEAVTGQQPALLGFELLSYSPNINYLETDEACMTEVQNNYGTLKRAWERAEQKGLITFTWHWFSPLGGHGKSFFTENTDFDADRALTEGTPENRALISDMDTMAGILRPFCDRQVPILWRPFQVTNRSAVVLIEIAPYQCIVFPLYGVFEELFGKYGLRLFVLCNE